jgi:hypothetical protein
MIESVDSKWPTLWRVVVEITKNEIEKLFPSVYITLISMLLGFAVEDVITQLRALNSIDTYSALTAVSILTAIIAVWTAYSFGSMTQKRLPRLMDVINVFFFAFCFYLLNSTIGLDIWYFFAAISIYGANALFAFIYNMKDVIKSVSPTRTLQMFRWDIVIVGHTLAIYPVAAWLSMKGMLSFSIDVSLIAYFFVINVIWTYFFSKAWSELINDIS